MEFKYFVSTKEFPRSMVRWYEFRYQHYIFPKSHYFRKDIYDWCIKHKIPYRKTKSPECGFLFIGESDAMAVKLRWL